MPRGNLTEKYVQQTALKKLKAHYQPRFPAAIACQEVGVFKKCNLGRGRADGLIVAQSAVGQIFIASFEAKSSRTLFNLLPWYKDEKWVGHAFMVGFISLLVAAVIAFDQTANWFWLWLFPVILFIVVAVAYLVITNDLSYYRPISVVAQAKRYPADEQWVVLSTDVFNQLGPEGKRTLLKDCQKEGIGLIRINAGEKMIIEQQPRPRQLPPGYSDFLECYARGQTLRQELQSVLDTLPAENLPPGECE